MHVLFLIVAVALGVLLAGYAAAFLLVLALRVLTGALVGRMHTT